VLAPLGGNRRPPWDFVSLLTIFAFTQILLPSRYVVKLMGAAGAPARLVALGVSVWWLIDWFGQPTLRPPIRQPLKSSALVFLAAILGSYVVATSRPIAPEELLSADRSVIAVVGWLGVMAAATDRILSRARLDTLLRRLTVLGAFEAGIGLLQFATGRTFIEYFRLPGLIDNSAINDIVSRNGFVRPAGTAIHPIEFGVSMAMLLPLALHYAVTDVESRSPISRWLPACAISVALPLTISRSAIICTAVALAVLLSSWPIVTRRWVYAAAGLMLTGLAVVLPGFLWAVFGLFGEIDQDSSALSRTNSYQLAWNFVARNPILGRGVGTFLPEYRILDNQYLGSLIELGFIGLACLMAHFLVGLLTAWNLRSWSCPQARDPYPRSQLGVALAAGIAAGCVSFAFFDAWGFPTIPSLMFIMMGCAGAGRRLRANADTTQTAAVDRTIPESDDLAGR